MSNPNLSYSNLDARYTKPSDVDTKIAAQATTDAGQYDAKMAARIRTLSHVLSRTYEPLPSISANPPTIAYDVNTNVTLPRIFTAQQLADIGIIRGAVSNWNATYNRMDIGGRPTVLDFWVQDTSVEVTWVEASANGTRIWTWVDGVPVESPPSTAPLTTSQGGSYLTRLTWGTRARRRVQMYFSGTNSFAAVRTSNTGWIGATGRLPKITIIGDSYVGGSNGSAPPNGISDVLSRTLQAEVQNEGLGGTGYVNGGPNGYPFSHTTRLSRVSTFNPDLIIFFGSINDSITGLQTAASSTYAAYATVCPKAPQIVVGVQPTGATTTISANLAQVANAIYNAATSSPNVMGFIDPIGYASTGVLPTVVNGSYATVTAGSLYSYQGGVYKALINGSTGPGVPGGSNYYELLSWYTGTGTNTSTTGDGNRDVFMYGGDNVHPTTEASYMWGLGIADAVVRMLGKYGSS